MSQALGWVLPVCGLTGSSGLPGPNPTSTPPCRVAWAGPWEGCSTWTRRKTCSPSFPGVCLWHVSAPDPSGFSLFVVHPSSWICGSRGSQALFFERLPQTLHPCSLGDSRTFISHWPAVPDVWLCLSRFSSLLFSLGGCSLPPPVHAHFLLPFLLFSELTHPLSFLNECCIFSWQFPLVLLLRDAGSYLNILFGGPSTHAEPRHPGRGQPDPPGHQCRGEGRGPVAGRMAV